MKNKDYIYNCSSDGLIYKTVEFFKSEKEYPFKSVREFEPEIIAGITAETLKKFPAFNSGDYVEIPAPFSFLASKIDPVNLYPEKDKELLKERLLCAADALAETVSEITRRGAKVVSVADAEGVTELVGERFFANISGWAAAEFLKKIEPYMTGAVTFICGKLSYSLCYAKFMTAEQRNFDRNLTYDEIILQCAESADYKFIGHGCIHRPPTETVINRLELC